MPHNRAPKPGSQYYLPYYDYHCIVNFCYTYPHMKLELATIDGHRSRQMDGMPHAPSQESTTERDAMRRAMLQSKIDLIEGAVMECAGEVMYDGMLAAITTDGMTMERMRDRYGIPMGKNQFCNLRRKIYWTIAKEVF